jgi:uncharacterized protein Yka (UPF0111/DUF47 family)
MPILIQKKEKPIIELIKQHADKVLETVGAARTAFSLYFDGKIEESRMYTKKIHDLEREADIIKKSRNNWRFFNPCASLHTSRGA